MVSVAFGDNPRVRNRKITRYSLLIFHTLAKTRIHMLCHDMSCHVMSCHVICYVTLYVICYAICYVTCYVMLCYVMLRYMLYVMLHVICYVICNMLYVILMRVNSSEHDLTFPKRKLNTIGSVRMA